MGRHAYEGNNNRNSSRPRVLSRRPEEEVPPGTSASGATLRFDSGVAPDLLPPTRTGDDDDDGDGMTVQLLGDSEWSQRNRELKKE